MARRLDFVKFFSFLIRSFSPDAISLKTPHVHEIIASERVLLEKKKKGHNIVLLPLSVPSRNFATELLPPVPLSDDHN